MMSRRSFAAALAFAAAGWFAVPAQAALITQTISFTVSDLEDGVAGAPPPYNTVTGEVVLTYDTDIASSITGQAVDSFSISSPAGVFPTSNVFFNLRIPPDVSSPLHTWELDVYWDTFEVSLVDDWDVLFRMASVNPLGADFGLLGNGVLFNYTDTNFTFFGNTTLNALSGSSVPAGSGGPGGSGGSGVPAPAALVLLGLGLVGAGAVARRRRAVA